MKSPFRNPRSLLHVSLAAAVALSICLGAAATASAQPAISITSGPAEGEFTKERKITFALSAIVPDAKQADFFCSLDNAVLFPGCHAINYPLCVPAAGGGQSCTQSISYMVSEGAHAFRTFAADCDAPCEPADDGVDGPMVTRNFTVDRTAPIASITAGPSLAAPAVRSAAAFNVTSTEPGTFNCSLDAGPPVICETSIAFPAIFAGTHSLSVTAVDRAGNASVPATVSFKVDRLKPKKCKKGKSVGAKKKQRKCKRANAIAKAKWKKRNRIR